MADISQNACAKQIFVGSFTFEYYNVMKCACMNILVLIFLSTGSLYYHFVDDRYVPFVAEICEIPESIRFCKNLQVVDFSSNPLSRLVLKLSAVYVRS